jgi:hypothetical protein
LKDPLPGVEIFNDFPAANPIEVSHELPMVCYITHTRTNYTIRDFGEWMKLCFAWMILCCGADDFYKGSWSELDAVTAGGVSAEVLHTGDYQKTANPLSR